ncbi:hypothetical protein C8R44DRAFT_761854 [Mycena epipterygia]|nr:hypothetical protein C8R44DRAFT_761854 [Mycena epipterygia]
MFHTQSHMSPHPVDPSVEETRKRTLLQIKRVDKIRLPDSGTWVVKNSENDAPASGPGHATDEYAEWAQHAFIVRRKVEQERGSDYPKMITQFLIRSDFLRRALREVMKDVQGISWTASILKYWILTYSCRSFPG